MPLGFGVRIVHNTPMHKASAEIRKNAHLPQRGSRRLKWRMAGNSSGVNLQEPPGRFGCPGQLLKKSALRERLSQEVVGRAGYSGRASYHPDQFQAMLESNLARHEG